MGKITSYTNASGSVTRHYDEDGKLMGESWTSPAGQVSHYDADGKKVGYSFKNASGHMTHYDQNGDKMGHSQVLRSGQVRHYDANYDRTGESTPNFWGAHVTERSSPEQSAKRPMKHSGSPGSGAPQKTEITGISAVVLAVFLLIGIYGLLAILLSID